MSGLVLLDIYEPQCFSRPPGDPRGAHKHTEVCIRIGILEGSTPHHPCSNQVTKVFLLASDGLPRSRSGDAKVDGYVKGPISPKLQQQNPKHPQLATHMQGLSENCRSQPPPFVNECSGCKVFGNPNPCKKDPMRVT